MKSTAKFEQSAKRRKKSGSVDPTSVDPKAAENIALGKGNAQLANTRGLLQQALADWESTEVKAQEALKEAEVQKDYIDDLLKELKAKLDQF